MNSRKKLLKKSNLYIIVDENLETAKKAIAHGADIIQLRIKNKSDSFILDIAQKLKKYCKKYKVLFLINDRADLAMISKADGVHLGQKDISIKSARKILGTDYIIGASTHSLGEAKKALSQKPDYIAIGSIFKTATKPHLYPLGISRAAAIINKTTIPYFVIGGINLKNIYRLLDKNINRIALYKAICKAKKPQITTRKFKGILLDHENTH
jgi:thiamine-phosphate pyrophosphorylase